jgi:hypothetical protein
VILSLLIAVSAQAYIPSAAWVANRVGVGRKPFRGIHARIEVKGEVLPGYFVERLSFPAPDSLLSQSEEIRKRKLKDLGFFGKSWIITGYLGSNILDASRSVVSLSRSDKRPCWRLTIEDKSLCFAKDTGNWIESVDGESVLLVRSYSSDLAVQRMPKDLEFYRSGERRWTARVLEVQFTPFLEDLGESSSSRDLWDEYMLTVR